MPVEHGMVGCDKSCSDINVFEGGIPSSGLALSRSSIMRWKRVLTSRMTSWRWGGMGEGGPGGLLRWPSSEAEKPAAVAAQFRVSIVPPIMLSPFVWTVGNRPHTHGTYASLSAYCSPNLPPLSYPRLALSLTLPISTWLVPILFATDSSNLTSTKTSSTLFQSRSPICVRQSLCFALRTQWRWLGEGRLGRTQLSS